MLYLRVYILYISMYSLEGAGVVTSDMDDVSVCYVCGKKLRLEFLHVYNEDAIRN